MVTTILLFIIYLAFISLGLPDALLGVAWPLIREEWHMGLDAAGAIAIVVTLGTISSSLLSGRLIKRYGEGKITLVSGLLTGFALLGYAFSPSYIWFVILALPLGFGAGSVDTALNHYVSQHFKAHHMNWLHAFWGVGATLGPVLMGSILGTSGSWRQGYQTVAGIQLALAAMIFVSLPLWKKHGLLTGVHEALESVNPSQIKQPILRLKGVPYALLIFMVYCAGEYAMGLWGASYLVQMRGLTLAVAARWVAFYYGSITVGRILSGVISFKLSNRQLIHLGIVIAFFGAVCLYLPFGQLMPLLAFICIGLGFAPIFPSMMHETPTRFGKEAAQSIIGYQMAAANIGVAVFPPLLGVIIAKTTMALFPFFMLGCVALLFILTRQMERLTAK